MLLTFYFSDTYSLEFLALVAESRRLEEQVFTLLNEKDLIRKNRDLQGKAHSQSLMRCDNLKCNNKIDDFKYYTGFLIQVFIVIIDVYFLLMNPFSI